MSRAPTPRDADASRASPAEPRAGPAAGPPAEPRAGAGARGFAVTLGAAFAGAAAALALGLPAAALVGSTVAVAGLAMAGLSGKVPDALRGAAFATIGVTLGAGITPSFLQDLARWPLSLALLTLTLAAGMALSGLVLTRGFGMRRDTAALGTSPGALSYALAMATEGGADLRAVVVLQSLRLMAITLLLPPVIALLGGGGGGGQAPLPGVGLGYAEGLALLAAAFGLGALGGRIGVPSAQLLAGIALSGALHAAGLVEGRLPGPLNTLGFAVAGAVIGARLSDVSWRELRAHGLAAAVVSGIGLALSGAASLGLARAAGLPFGQVWVAFAPGGVESMAAMALTMGYDPVYVATHHVFRLLGLLVALPLILRAVR